MYSLKYAELKWAALYDDDDDAAAEVETIFR